MLLILLTKSNVQGRISGLFLLPMEITLIEGAYWTEILIERTLCRSVCITSVIWTIRLTAPFKAEHNDDYDYVDDIVDDDDYDDHGHSGSGSKVKLWVSGKNDKIFAILYISET